MIQINKALFAIYFNIRNCDFKCFSRVNTKSVFRFIFEKCLIVVLQMVSCILVVLKYVFYRLHNRGIDILISRYKTFHNTDNFFSSFVTTIYED